MSARRAPKASPEARAREALGMICNEITWDEINGDSDGEDNVRHGLDALASALVDWRELDLGGGAPLDEVLAALGQDDDLVERTARLIEFLGQATYGGGLREKAAKAAERIREDLALELERLLDQLQEEDDESGDHD